MCMSKRGAGLTNSTADNRTQEVTDHLVRRTPPQIKPDLRVLQVPADGLQAATDQRPLGDSLADRHPALAWVHLTRPREVLVLVPAQELVGPDPGGSRSQRRVPEPSSPKRCVGVGQDGRVLA